MWILSRWRRLRTEAAHLRLGRWGERMALRHLKKVPQLRILGKRVRCGKHDEIDILARDGAVLVIVEVKTRRDETFAAPRTAVDREKRYRLSRAAVRYARRLRQRPDALRFDIVEVVGEPGRGKPLVRHLPAAFGLDHRFRW